MNRQADRQLDRRSLGGLAVLGFAVALVCFGGAGTFDYWQGWLFLAMYLLPATTITLYLMRRNRPLLERRVRVGPIAEREPAQQIIMRLLSVGSVGLLLVPALDHRFGWSRMAWPVVLGGDGLMAAGWFGIYRVFRENPFSAATVERAPDQTVITTGPYARIRHPMYAAGAVMLLGMPLALGSWWGIGWLAAMMPALLWRLLDEEAFLLRELPGYASYRETVRYRLVPRVW